MQGARAAGTGAGYGTGASGPMHGTGAGSLIGAGADRPVQAIPLQGTGPAPGEVCRSAYPQYIAPGTARGQVAGAGRLPP